MLFDGDELACLISNICVPFLMREFSHTTLGANIKVRAPLGNFERANQVRIFSVAQAGKKRNLICN